MTAEKAREALDIVARIKEITRAKAEAETIQTTNAYGPNESGLTIKLTPEITRAIKALRLKELDDFERVQLRRAAQLDL